jgi:hypothetical protein
LLVKAASPVSWSNEFIVVPVEAWVPPPKLMTPLKTLAVWTS